MIARPRLLDWHLTPDGVQVYADWQGMGEGWLNMTRQCPECDHVWEAVAAVKSLGIECPKCGHADVHFVWDDPGGIDLRTRKP